eukprot:4537676-Prymnesium_polylepis.1
MLVATGGIHRRPHPKADRWRSDEQIRKRVLKGAPPRPSLRIGRRRLGRIVSHTEASSLAACPRVLMGRVFKLQTLADPRRKRFQAYLSHAAKLGAHV